MTRKVAFDIGPDQLLMLPNATLRGAKWVKQLPTSDARLVKKSL
jgi:hypothetical protein